MSLELVMMCYACHETDPEGEYSDWKPCPKAGCDGHIEEFGDECCQGHVRCPDCDVWFEEDDKCETCDCCCACCVCEDEEEDE